MYIYKYIYIYSLFLFRVRMLQDVTDTERWERLQLKYFVTPLRNSILF